MTNNFDVAVIGMSCRFSDAGDVDSFWQIIANKQKTLRTLSREELRERGVTDTQIADPAYVSVCSSISDIDKFDASFFGYSATEASLIDPQQRMFLELCWHVIEDAGYDPKSFKGNIGLFAGVGANSYLVNNLLASGRDLEPQQYQVFIANEKDFLTTRIAYKLGLTGPCISVQTGCSSSLVSIHLACQSLQNGDCDIALAGGVSLKMPQSPGYRYQKDMILSADGHCYAFDHRASGSIHCDGAGVVALKLLSDALADGDHIEAVIKGSAVNNDGAEKIGFTAPAIQGQARVISAALGIADVKPDSIGYIEAHGTGTILGDPIEIEALNRVFKDVKHKIPIGSLKTNIGHADAAAGVAGFIKTTMALKSKTIPASLNFEKCNPNIDFAKSSLFVNTDNLPWETSHDHPRRAGISSFGIGGTNAHVVLEEAPPPGDREIESSKKVLVLSAKSEDAIVQMACNLQAFLRASAYVNIDDVGYTLQTGRQAFDYRMFVTTDNVQEAIEKLGRCHNYIKRKKAPAIEFFFDSLPHDLNDVDVFISGNLYFLAAAQEIANAVAALLHVDIHTFLNERDLNTGVKNENPLIRDCVGFMLSYATAQYFLKLGIAPSCVNGNGKGLIVAACVSGLLKLTDALALLHYLTGDVERTDIKEFVSALRFNTARYPTCDSRAPLVTFSNNVTDPMAWCQQIIDASQNKDLAVSGAANVTFSIRIAETLSVRRHGEIKQEQVIGSYINQCAAEILGEFWALGVPVEWKAIHPPKTRKRISLPGYAFQRQSYWIHPGKGDSDVPAKTSDVEKWLYTPVWKQSVVRPNRKENVPACWVVFYEFSDLLNGIIYELEASGSQIIRVMKGARLEKIDDISFTVDPTSLADIKHIFDQFANNQSGSVGVLYSWNLATTSAFDIWGGDDISAENLKYFDDLLLIAQGSAEITSPSKTDLVILSDNRYQILGVEKRNPFAALVDGVVKVLPLEHQNIIVRHIDLDITLCNNPTSVRNVVAEILADDKVEAIVAYRGAIRWIQSFDRLHAERSKPVDRFRQGGVYVVTGGLGGLGYTICKYLLAKYGAKLIVLGRSLADPLQPKGKQFSQTRMSKEEKLKALQANGNEVIFIPTDVNNYHQVSEAMAQAKRKFGVIHGMIHAAGVPDSGLIQRKQKQLVNEVFASKVGGTVQLIKVLRKENPDLIVFFSSLNSYVGSPGQVSYVAANAFIESVANCHVADRGTFVTSIAWDLWIEDGMAIPALVNKKHLPDGITNAEGESAFALAMTQRVSNVVISLSEINARLAATKVARDAEEPEDISDDSAEELSGDRVRQIVEQIWREQLGIKEIAATDDFFDLGGDSLIALQVIARFKKHFKIEASLHDLFELTTVADHSQYVQSLIESKNVALSAHNQFDEGLL